MDDWVIRFRVGVVVVAAAVITVILITLIGAWPSVFRSTYRVNVKFPEAPGVSEDTPIRKSGVEIGRVSGVELLDDGVLVKMRIDSEYPLRQYEVPRITTGSLVTGDAVIEFVRGEGPDEPILDRDYLTNGQVAGQPLEILANLEGDMAQAIGSIDNASAEVARAAGQINSLIADNREQIDRILVTAEDALASFDTTMEQVEAILGDGEIQAHLRDTASQLPLVMAEAQLTLWQAQQALRSFEQVGESARRNLQNLEDFTEPLSERGDQLAEDIGSAAQNVDRLVAELTEFSQALNDRDGTLGQLIYNPELYRRLELAARNIESASRRVEPILNDLRVFSDKIARDPRQLGVRGALGRQPNGAGFRSSPLLDGSREEAHGGRVLPRR